jgi:SAM-dependent methyltransferase
LLFCASTNEGFVFHGFFALNAHRGPNPGARNVLCIMAHDHSPRERAHPGLRQSAGTMVPLVVETLRPRSVINIGCGDGTWLAVFREHGVERLHGIDDAVPTTLAPAIGPELLRVHDLCKPLQLDTTFDLAVAIDVAEHLPAAAAATLVRSLTRAATMVLFAAAIPHQRGRNHCNEQWPEYWIELFAARDFECVDCFRRHWWTNEAVTWWHAQNTLLFVARARFGAEPHLRQLRDEATRTRLPVRLVHPRAYLGWVEECELQKDWANRMFLFAHDLAPWVERGATFVLVDDAQFEPWAVPDGRKALPFLEVDGRYWGPPGADDTAISELERMRAGGVTHIAFGWPAFWWFDFFRGFHHHLRTRHRCVLQNQRAVVFDLRAEPAAGSQSPHTSSV